MKFCPAFSLLATFATVKSTSVKNETKGEVDFWRCGGYGTPVWVMIDGCEKGQSCNITPGQSYLMEFGFIPISYTYSNMRLEKCVETGPCELLDDFVLPSWNPGGVYVAIYTLKSDSLNADISRIRAVVYLNHAPIIDVCLDIYVKVNIEQ